MKIMNQTICETFKNQASRISKEIARANYTGLGIQEETLSELLLNRIQFEHDENFITRKFTKKEEGNITGADWLWCIGEPGSWITFAVQAKIVSPATERVNYLHYRKGEQYNLLINFCKQFRFIPKYSVFYEPNEDIEIFAKGMEELRDIPLEQWSLSMISPKYVNDLLTPKDRHISKVLQFSLPWSYLFCNHSTKFNSIADGIANNLEKTYWKFENEFRRQRNQKTSNHFNQIIWENPQPYKMITKDLPLPVLYLLTSGYFPHKVPISNVSLYSTTSAQHVLDSELKRIEGQRRWKGYPETFERAILRIQESKTIYLLPDQIQRSTHDHDAAELLLEQ